MGQTVRKSKGAQINWRVSLDFKKYLERSAASYNLSISSYLDMIVAERMRKDQDRATQWMLSHDDFSALVAGLSAAPPKSDALEDADKRLTKALKD